MAAVCVADCVPVAALEGDAEGDPEGVLLVLAEEAALGDGMPETLGDEEDTGELLAEALPVALREDSALLLRAEVGVGAPLPVPLAEGEKDAMDAEAGTVPVTRSAVGVWELLLDAVAQAVAVAQAEPLPPPRPAPPEALPVRLSVAEPLVEPLDRPVREPEAEKEPVCVALTEVVTLSVAEPVKEGPAEALTEEEAEPEEVGAPALGLTDSLSNADTRGDTVSQELWEGLMLAPGERLGERDMVVLTDPDSLRLRSAVGESRTDRDTEALALPDSVAPVREGVVVSAVEGEAEKEEEAHTDTEGEAELEGEAQPELLTEGQGLPVSEVDTEPLGEERMEGEGATLSVRDTLAVGVAVTVAHPEALREGEPVVEGVAEVEAQPLGEGEAVSAALAVTVALGEASWEAEAQPDRDTVPGSVSEARAELETEELTEGDFEKEGVEEPLLEPRGEGVGLPPVGGTEGVTSPEPEAQEVEEAKALPLEDAEPELEVLRDADSVATPLAVRVSTAQAVGEALGVGGAEGEGVAVTREEAEANEDRVERPVEEADAVPAWVTLRATVPVPRTVPVTEALPLPVGEMVPRPEPESLGEGVGDPLCRGDTLVCAEVEALPVLLFCGDCEGSGVPEAEGQPLADIVSVREPLAV